MKPNTAEQRHHDAVIAIAKNYDDKGYNVLVEPNPEDVPEFLRPYKPDLLVDAGDKRYVIEVATSLSKKQEGFWSTLAEKISRQPGWHFKIVVAEADEENGWRVHSLPDADEIEAQLEATKKLITQDQTAAALLLAWSLFEASARLRMVDDDRDPAKPAPPAALLKSLIHFGYLEQFEFEPLREVMKLRNEVAHGFFDAPVPAAVAHLLVGVTERLLQRTPDDE